MDLSVCVTTYNHARYIRQALDGVLQQRLPFEWEVLIGEDDSTDGTRGIVREYAEKHPDRVRALFRDAPAGRMDAGRGNFLNTLRSARGRYVALLDGDDYWTSPDKLRRQVELLERNPSYSGCFHNVQVLYEGAAQRSAPHFVGTQPEVFEIRDLASAGRNLIPACSVVFRRELIPELPKWFYAITAFGDWTLHLLNAEHGPFGYIDDVLATYRIHGAGSWSGLSSMTQLKAAISGAQVLDRSFGYRYHREFSKSIYIWRMKLAFTAMSQRRYVRSGAYFSRALFDSPRDFGRRATAGVPNAWRALKALARV